MVNELKTELVDSAKPMVNWLSEKGADFAIDFVAAVIIILVGMLVIRVMTKLLKRVVERKVGDREMLERFLMSVAVKGAWAVLIMIVLDKLGVAVGPLIAGLGATGFILGFAFQESLGSLAAGIMIAFNQPFKLGDYVFVGGHEGTVKQLDMMAVVLATGDNRKITIPNKQAWGGPIINYSALELRRVDIAIGITYGADITKAKEIAKNALAALPAVLKDPAPMSEVKSLDDSAVVLTSRAWVKNADYWPTFFAANQRVKEAFDASNISIPFPQVDVHMVKEA